MRIVNMGAVFDDFSIRYRLANISSILQLSADTERSVSGTTGNVKQFRIFMPGVVRVDFELRSSTTSHVETMFELGGINAMVGRTNNTIYTPFSVNFPSSIDDLLNINLSAPVGTTAFIRNVRIFFSIENWLPRVLLD